MSCRVSYLRSLVPHRPQRMCNTAHRIRASLNGCEGSILVVITPTKGCSTGKISQSKLHQLPRSSLPIVTAGRWCFCSSCRVLSSEYALWSERFCCGQRRDNKMISRSVVHLRFRCHTVEQRMIYPCPCIHKSSPVPGRSGCNSCPRFF